MYSLPTTSNLHFKNDFHINSKPSAHVWLYAVAYPGIFFGGFNKFS